MTPAEEIAALKAEVTEQREQIVRLVERVRELEARLAKDSHNSSRPPASDGLKRQLPRTRSLRRKSGKQPGGQLGHPGGTLHLVTEPDAVIAYRPAVCATCQSELDGEDEGAAPEVVARERRQVYDLPPIRLHVTEHQALSVRCPTCQQITTGAFPAEATSRAQYGPRLRALAVYLVAQQFVPYARLSAGTLVARGRQSAQALAPVVARLKSALHGAPRRVRAAQ